MKAFFLLAAALLASPCVHAAVTVTDDAGQTITLPQPA
ncbi:MAG: cobalamin-binding protein, partial [Cupriavidus sp.]|nr:cobalamin-binding protein [Cupriavidus sp.]